jgi:ketosteroid isomerase-like protein
MNTDQQTAADIVALERAALDRWGRGDPSGYLEISAPDVSYFDPYLPRRLDGHRALAEWYAPLTGTIRIDHYEMLNPEVQLAGDTAILTFNLASRSGTMQMNWNSTEIYRRLPQGWRIVHTHWSITQHLNN